MNHPPPPFREADFIAVDIMDEVEIKRRFGGMVRSLHSYLNEVPCLHDLQQARRRWKSRVPEEDAFGTFATDPRHWYTFNHGGRTEAQFNIGLYPTHLRVGLGFEFTLKKGGDPTVVGLIYSCFTHIVSSEQDFRRFVTRSGLEIEWVGKSNPSLQFVESSEVMNWLLRPPDEPFWIFVGKLLRRGSDEEVLKNSELFDGVVQSVFGGLRPYWERTQLMAK